MPVAAVPGNKASHNTAARKPRPRRYLPFFSLPLELRQQIYCELLCSRSICDETCTKCGESFEEHARKELVDIHIDILMVNHDIYAEALPILYKKSAYPTRYGQNDGFSTMGRIVGLPESYLRTLVTKVDAWIPNENWANFEGEPQWLEWGQYTLQDFPNLSQLTLRFPVRSREVLLDILLIRGKSDAIQVKDYSSVIEHMDLYGYPLNAIKSAISMLGDFIQYWVLRWCRRKSEFGIQSISVNRLCGNLLETHYVKSGDDSLTRLDRFGTWGVCGCW